ncbi:MAG: Flp pilus assembly complex ATPase component TadA [Lentisphaerae bacterium]|nr:Flp pilus assembly complex ATPase component TadA [Lentisphaerota bacterium]
MTAPSSTRLAELLKRTGLFQDEQIKALLEKTEGGASITRRVVESGYASEEAFLEAIGKELACPFIRLNEVKIEPAVIARLPAKVVFQYNVIPLQLDNSILRVVTNDPFNSNLADALRLVSGLRIRLSLSLADDIGKAINKFYGVGADTMERLVADKGVELPPEEIMAKVDLSELDQEASIVKFVNQIIWEAYKDRATDIHFEPMADELRIRYRVDGVLHQTSMPPQLKRFQAAIVSRIKVMANMDIAEKRLPQDGRIGLGIHGEDLDIRVSTIPTVYGESVSLRLLTRKSELLGLESVGMNSRDEAIIRKLIVKPNGILLVTGPTGSGKSTTLYACLHTINSIEQRIITVEEPIEYEMAGINQIQVRPEIGLTFATGLRHILRQDPDVIMLGEIRDFETAEIAIRAALTGHLVLSTLHTNDSAGAITRLIDMGVEPFLVASSVEAIIAQRLVRILCKECKRELKPDNPVRKSIASVSQLAGAKVYGAIGCDQCRRGGYRGRIGIFENLLVTDAIRRLIVERAAANVIKQKGLEQGMQTLRDDGWVKVREGTTTIEEVLRVTEEEENG